MPYKPKVPCRHPGCPNVIPAGQKYCEAHKQPEPETRPSRSNGDWYNLARWQRLRKQILAREPFCRECMKEGHAVIATDVDHIKSHRGNPELFWDPRNLQPLCHSCHSKKTREEDMNPVYDYRF